MLVWHALFMVVYLWHIIYYSLKSHKAVHIWSWLEVQQQHGLIHVGVDFKADNKVDGLPACKSVPLNEDVNPSSPIWEMRWTFEGNFKMKRNTKNWQNCLCYTLFNCHSDGLSLHGLIPTCTSHRLFYWQVFLLTPFGTTVLLTYGIL
jgi:hypothetical protein